MSASKNVLIQAYVLRDIMFLPVPLGDSDLHHERSCPRSLLSLHLRSRRRSGGRGELDPQLEIELPWSSHRH